MGSTVDAQPGKTLSVKKYIRNIYKIIAALAKETKNPIKLIRRKGTKEKDVIASRDKAIIRFNGYFVTPAKRFFLE